MRSVLSRSDWIRFKAQATNFTRTPPDEPTLPRLVCHNKVRIFRTCRLVCALRGICLRTPAPMTRQPECSLRNERMLRRQGSLDIIFAKWIRFTTANWAAHSSRNGNLLRPRIQWRCVPICRVTFDCCGDGVERSNLTADRRRNRLPRCSSGAPLCVCPTPTFVIPIPPTFAHLSRRVDAPAGVSTSESCTADPVINRAPRLNVRYSNPHCTKTCTRF
jgi:hypothetical protein